MKAKLANIGKEYGILSILILVGICIVYQVWTVDVINTPLCYTQDGIGTLVSEKSLIEEGGWGMTCSRLGAPYGQDTSDFTTATLLPIVLLKVGAVFTDNWVWALNLSYFIGYFIMAWISYYVLKRMGISHVYAGVLAILYTFLPYHMMRGTEHFSLAFYALVPVAIYYVILFMSPSEKNLKDISAREKIEFIIWMLLIGINGIYYSFFTCFLFCVAILYNLLQKNGAESVKKCIYGIVNIMLGIILVTMPSIIYMLQNGINTATAHRLRSEIATYALRISQLLLPITGHRIPLLAKVKEIYNKSFVVNENDSASLGIIFSAGFILLIIYLLLEKKEKKDIIGRLSAINICMVIYASVGGFVEIQAIIFRMIRCSNRISVFIAFVCCVAIGIAMDRISCSKNWGKNKIIVGGLILALGFFDQTKADYVNEGEILAQMENQRNFIASIENSEDSGAMIFQLPNVVYPEQGMKERMGDYSHFIGYLYSDTLKWSYGAMKGREGSKLLEEISQKDTKEMIEAMKEEGFAGIYIDRWGYKDEEVRTLEEELKKLLNIEPLEDMNQRYAYYTLNLE